MIEHYAAIIATGITGGVAAAVVTVSLVELPSASVLVGGSVVAALGAAFMAFMVKKFAELLKKADEGPSKSDFAELLKKASDSPTKLDFFDSNLRLETQSSRHHQSILGQIEKLEGEIYEVRDTVQKQFHDLDRRIVAIDARHDAMDRRDRTKQD